MSIGNKAVKVVSLMRWSCFETRFPFFAWDCSGFQSLLFEARKITNGNDGTKRLKQCDYVTFESLQQVFSINKLWTESLEPGSKFYEFLNATCKLDEKTYGPNAYSLRKLKCFGVLWCKGSDEQKIMELYKTL